MIENLFVILAIALMFGALIVILHPTTESFVVGIKVTKGNVMKQGNNGSVSCQTFCTGAWSGGPKGNCVKAYDTKGKHFIDCGAVRGVDGAGVVCECASKLAVSGTDTLTTPKCIGSGQALVSKNKTYRAVMQDDGNFVVYEKAKAIWSTHHGAQLNSTVPISHANKPYVMCIDGSGNMTVKDKNKAVTWSSDTGGKDMGPFNLTIQNDGQLSLRGKHVQVWSSKWSSKCVDVLNWWKQYKNHNAINPWLDYIGKLKKREIHVWPGPKCYDCDGAKRQYHLTYPDVGKAVDAAIHASGHKERVWKGTTSCMPRPIAATPPRPIQHTQQTQHIQPTPNPTPQVPVRPQPTPVNGVLDAQVRKFKEDWPAANFDRCIQDLMSTGKCSDARPNVYGQPQILANKTQFVRVMRSKGLSQQLQGFLLAFAMIETGTLTVRERDALKDWQSGAENFTLFNINTSMINDTLAKDPELAGRVGPLLPPPQSKLNEDSDAGISLAIDVVLKGIEVFGMDKYVSYLRGGVTLFNDNTDYRNDSFGGFYVRVFKCGFSKIAEMIESDPSLLVDDRRVALCIPYV
jgi:hypothetical protein